MIVPTLPKFAGIDPFVKYIDSDLIDNNKAISYLDCRLS
ncbi:MAG: hypothetical protein ACI9FB_000822 [Candidatus Azotimanducaceae bacterium]|jgi:hypothetical protein